VWFAERGGSGAAGLGLPDRSAPRAAELVSWADWLQEQFFPETRGAWGEARPECPGHPHPASAVELDGEAWWCARLMVGRSGGLAGWCDCSESLSELFERRAVAAHAVAVTVDLQHGRVM
jgi:hypothetical protein